MTVEGQGSGNRPGATPGPAVDQVAEDGHRRTFPIKLPFLEEFKRRNLGRVAILYIVVCYLVLEPYELFFHLLELPAWAGRGVVLLMALGFPAVLLFAWIYEVTPEGLKPSSSVPPSRSIARHTGQRLNQAIIVVLSLALAYFVADKYWLSKRFAASEITNSGTSGRVKEVGVPGHGDENATAIPDKSIAVLPFVDMSEKKDQEYFSDGLAEEMLDLLSRVPDLRVAARTSAFAFKGKSDDIPTIAKRLFVANVLEGSVRKSGNMLRVTAQLVRAENGYHLWSRTYDRRIGDLFKVQNEIASSVVQALKITLAENAIPRAIESQSSEAHSLYLQARAIYYSRADSLKDFEKADGYLRQSIDLDDSYAPAYILRSELNAEWEKWELADQMADKALQLAANLPEAHTAKARILFQHNWNWKDAEAQFDEALRLGPTNSSALYWVGTFSIWSGRFDEGLLLQKKSVESDPVNSDKMLGYAWSLFHGEKFTEAMEVAKKVNDLAPSRSESHIIVGSVLLGKKEPALALAEFNRADNEYFRQWGRALAYHDLDRRAESDLAMSYLEREHHSDAYVCAQVRAYRGDIDKAFEWLDRGIKSRNLNIVYVKTDSLFKKAIFDPRYKQFLRRLNIPAEVNGSMG